METSFPNKLDNAIKLGRDINWQTVSYKGKQIKIYDYDRWLSTARSVDPNINTLSYLAYSQNSDLFILGFTQILNTSNTNEYLIWYSFEIDINHNINNISRLKHNLIDFDYLIDLNFHQLSDLSNSSLIF